MMGRYFLALRHADQALGEFLDELKRRGLAERTMIAIYGDHDAGNYVDPEMWRLLGFEIDDEIARRRADRIPFLIHLPTIDQRTLANGSQVDIATTLLPLLGISTRGRFMVGRNLLHETSPSVLLPDGAVTNSNDLFIRGGPDHAAAMHDLATGRRIERLSETAWVQEAERRARVSQNILEGNLIPKAVSTAR
jgi:phosphoglycerol transferase MdoB-like AlkP superfamily enzyme